MKRFCPVLIPARRRDPTVPVAEAYQLRDLLEKRIFLRIKIYPGAGHGFDGEIWRRYGPARVEVSTRAFGREQ